jgi:hypothetical protein
MPLSLGRAPVLAPCLLALGLMPAGRGPLALPADLARARGQPVVRELQHAAAGLVFVSEADFPVEVLAWPSKHGVPTADRVARLAGWPPGSPVVEQTVADFFATAVTPQPWQSAAEKGAAGRFQTLVHVLQARLSATRVFRFGSIEIEAYVVGVTSSGDWAGVFTHLVQT